MALYNLELMYEPDYECNALYPCCQLDNFLIYMLQLMVNMANQICETWSVKGHPWINLYTEISSPCYLSWMRLSCPGHDIYPLFVFGWVSVCSTQTTLTILLDYLKIRSSRNLLFVLPLNSYYVWGITVEKVKLIYYCNC